MLLNLIPLCYPNPDELTLVGGGAASGHYVAYVNTILHDCSTLSGPPHYLPLPPHVPHPIQPTPTLSPPIHPMV